MRVLFFKRVRVSIILAITMLYAVNGYAQNLKTNQRINPNTETAPLTQAESQRPATDADLKASGNTSPFDAVKGKKEDASKRDAFSKHYINEDGSFTALIGAGPIHYERNGQFLDIDHTITQSSTMNFPFANTTNLMESYFGTTVEYGVKSKTMEGEVVEFMNPTMYWEVNGQAMGTQQAANTQAQIQADKATYPNIYGDISAEYKVLTGKREMNYIIPNPQALGAVPAGADYLVFTEDVVLPFGWTSSLTETGIMIKDAMGQEIYLYENPHSTDAESHALREENTIFETLQIGNTLTIKTKVKTEWLLSNERVFPVMVDPTTNVYPNNAEWWTGVAWDDGEDNSGEINVGKFNFYPGIYWVEGFARFNLETIPNNSIVNSAIGYINIESGTGVNIASRTWAFVNSADPLVNSGNAYLYNTMDTSLSQSVQVTSTGWRNSTFSAGGRTYIENSINNNFTSMGIYAMGTWQVYTNYANATYLTVSGYSKSTRPYLIITYTEPITDRTLEVVGAGDGASHADGSYTYDNDTPLLLESGTKEGYEFMGWTGTGSVPATGTLGALTFNITQNSSIEWLWEAIQPEFHNYGGSEQLAFNNSRIDTENPVFRLSHKGGTANGYQIQISNSADFTSGTVSQTFTGTYAAEEENNFTFTNGSFTSGTTYYVRAAVDMGGGYLTDGWTTDTYSFTYQSEQEIPSWFQTTQAQFETDELSGVIADANNDVVTGAGGNLVVNGDFNSGNTNNWTKTGTNGTVKVADVANNDNGFPGQWLRMGSPIFSQGSTGVGTIVVSQEIDLTNVSEITFNAGKYYSLGSPFYDAANTKAEFIIGGTLTNASGTVAATITQGGASRQDKTVDVSGYTGVQTIKFVVTYISSWHGNGFLMYYFDDVVASAPPSGTITSTPIKFESVLGAEGYAGITWNQTLGDGDLTLKVQQSANGTSGWADVAGYNTISMTGDGEKTFDLSAMPVSPHIRLVGNLDGANVVLHDWAVEFLKITDDCPTSTTWNGTSWTNGAPDELTERIIFEGNFTSTLINTDSGNLTGCSLEVLSGNVVISSGHSVTLDKEIKVSGGSFTLENEASLVQIQADAVNTGNITVKRNTTEMVKFDATYWSSPVSGQNLKEFSSATLNNRFYIYNGYNAAPEGISPHFKAVFVNDANYPMPPSIPGGWNVPTDELIGNLFRMDTYTFKPGWGYSIRVPNNWPHPLGTAGGILAEEFTGVPHNGDISVPAYGKYTMVGNPYPSPIQTMGESGFFQANPDVETLHFWTHHFDVTQLPEYNFNYVTFTRIGDAGVHPGETEESIPNGIIAVGQGFVVENSTIPQEQSPNKWDVVFTNEMRTTDQGIFIKPFDEEIEKHRFWLSVSDINERKLAQILVGYMTDATYEFDHQIDGRRLGTAPLFSWIGEEAFTVQGRTLPFEIEDVVKLGFTAHVDGKFKIGLDNFDGFFSDEIIRIYVRDHLNQIEHDLMSADYWFESEGGEFPTRFEIIYKTEEVLANEELDKNQVIIYHNPNNIVIQSQKEKILEVELWDLSGKKLHQNKKVNTNSYEIKRTHFGTQVLLVKVLTANGEITSKKIINY